MLDDFQHALQALLTGEQTAYYGDFGRLADFAKAYQSGFVLTGQHSKYRGCRWGASSADIPADRFVAFAGNHDTVGNRPAGERLGRLVDFEELKLAAAATILSPAIPFLFMGEEYDDPAPFYFFTSHLDPKLAAAVRAGREREFAEHGWPRGGGRSAIARDVRGVATHSLAGHERTPRRAVAVLSGIACACVAQTPAIRQPDRQQVDVTVLEDERVLIAQRQAGRRSHLHLLEFWRGAAGSFAAPARARSHGEFLLDSSEPRWMRRR